MEYNLGVSLSTLYKKDSFYSFCLSDLMRAPQPVTNQFLKEQRNLTESLKSIDRCQLSRVGQLNEEKRQFALLMKRRLAPRSSRTISFTTDRESLRTFSVKSFRDPTSAQSSIQSSNTVSTLSSYRIGTASLIHYNNTEWKKIRLHTSQVSVTRDSISNTIPEKTGHCRQSIKRVRSDSCFHGLRSDNTSPILYN